MHKCIQKYMQQIIHKYMQTYTIRPPSASLAAKRSHVPRGPAPRTWRTRIQQPPRRRNAWPARQTAAVGKAPIALKSVQNRRKGFFVSPDGFFFVPLWDKKKPICVREQSTAGSPQQLHDFHKEMQCVGGEGVFSVPEGVFVVPIMGFFLSLYGVLFGPEGVFFVLYPSWESECHRLHSMSFCFPFNIEPG